MEFNRNNSMTVEEVYYNNKGFKSNTKTRPCRNVIENGVCSRSNCSYAHNDDELRIPECTFTDKCFRRDEATLRYGQALCKFKHPGESREDYLLKLGYTLPLFPAVKEIKLVFSVRDGLEHIMEKIREKVVEEYDNIIIKITV